MNRDEQIRHEAEQLYPLPKPHFIDASDYMNESILAGSLRQAYIAGANRSGWIRVEDGLPENLVIVYGWKSPWGCGVNCRMRDGVFYDARDGEPWDITHYQYLPLPPVS